MPLGIAATLAARMTMGNEAPFVAIFWIVTLAAVAIALMASRRWTIVKAKPAVPEFAP